MKTRKIRLEQWGSRGWTWEVKGGYYRTDTDGEGLWEWRRDGNACHVEDDGTLTPAYTWKQTLGCSQYFLPKDRKKAYDKLYREWFRSDREDDDGD